MVAAGSALQWDVVRRILIAWLVTLPVTILLRQVFTIYSKVRPRRLLTEDVSAT